MYGKNPEPLIILEEACLHFFITYFFKWHRLPHVIQYYTSVGRTASKKLRLEKSTRHFMT